MNYTDKINIYVPEQIGTQLLNDARQFEIYKNDGETINRNKFLNMVTTGYHEQFVLEGRKAFNSVYDLLMDKGIGDTFAKEAASLVVNDLSNQRVTRRKGIKSTKLSIKPTKDTAMLIAQAVQDIAFDESISRHFCNMLISYSKHPLPDRERIVFRKSFDFIERMCEKQQAISFTTIWDKKRIHTVVPYMITTGKEEMFHYLLCEEYDDHLSKYVARSYRISRIENMGLAGINKMINPEIISCLKKMREYGPQFSINEDETVMVRMTPYGERLYKRISYGRPLYCSIIKKEDGNYYTFNCSEDQVFLYFRRFEKGDAVIISPERLRERMIEFHRSALDAYV